MHKLVNFGDLVLLCLYLPGNAIATSLIIQTYNIHVAYNKQVLNDITRKVNVIFCLIV